MGAATYSATDAVTVASWGRSRMDLFATSKDAKQVLHDAYEASADVDAARGGSRVYENARCHVVFMSRSDGARGTYSLRGLERFTAARSFQGDRTFGPH